MYIEGAIPALAATLRAVSDGATEILLAHGRNRQAEPAFLRACVGKFTAEDVPSSELDAVYQCTDVRVLRLRKST
jgi:hypothetical protein